MVITKIKKLGGSYFIPLDKNTVENLKEFIDIKEPIFVNLESIRNLIFITYKCEECLHEFTLREDEEVYCPIDDSHKNITTIDGDNETLRENIITSLNQNIKKIQKNIFDNYSIILKNYDIWSESLENKTLHMMKKIENTKQKIYDDVENKTQQIIKIVENNQKKWINIIESKKQQLNELIEQNDNN